MKCPICASLSHGLFARWPDYEVRECRDCGFRFIDTSAPGYPKDAQYAYHEGSIGPIRPWLPHIRRRVRDILRHQSPPGAALDIGCGRGEVVLALRQVGFDGEGIDLKPELIDHLRQRHPDVSWRRATTSELTASPRRYDVVSLYHVLEHADDPKGVLEGVAGLCNPRGLVVVEVPNVGGLEARLKGRRWHYYKVDHVSYFRVSDLERLARRVGLKVLDVRGYQHFSHPQDVFWKDAIKGGLARLGFQDVVSVFLRKEGAP